MRNINYQSPKETHEQEDFYFHKLDLIVDGIEIGKAELFYKNSPFPFYYLSWVEIKPEYRGGGHGGFFLAAINEFINERGKAGILTNLIPEDSPAHLVYANYGWQEVGGHSGWYIYNSPYDLSYERLDKAIYAIKQMMD